MVVHTTVWLIVLAMIYVFFRFHVMTLLVFSASSFTLRLKKQIHTYRTLKFNDSSAITSSSKNSEKGIVTSPLGTISLTVAIVL